MLNTFLFVFFSIFFGGFLSKNALRFHINWKLTLFAALFFPLLCSLGVWQLGRAEEKRSLQEAWSAQQALPPLPYAVGDAVDGFRQVSVEGQLDHERYWLLEARQFQGRLGYQVVMPFVMDSGVLLVNRGWVEAGKYREQNPEFPPLKNTLAISGALVEPSDSPMIDESSVQQVAWPHRILEIDTQLLQQQYGLKIDRYVLQIAPDDPAAFAVDWQPINMSPQKHTAYAVQWFSMAVVLLLLWLFASSNAMSVLTKRA